MKLQKFAETEIEKRESDGENREEAEKEILSTIKKAQDRKSLFPSRDEYK